jgi:hypothetical protein
VLYIILGLVAGVVVIGLPIGMIALFAWWRWSSEPAYWNENRAYLEATPAQELDRVAEAFEKRVPMEVSLIPVGQTREVRLPLAEINAWLARRLGPWMGQQGQQLPEHMLDPMVAGDGHRLVVAVRYDSADLQRVFSIVCDYDTLEDGRGRLRIVEARGGNLSLPIQTLLGQMDPADLTGEGVQYLGDGDPTWLFDPLFPVDTNRNARLVSATVDGEDLVLEVRSENRRSE